MARYIDAELFDKKLAMEVYLADDEDFTKAFVRGMELVKKAENETPIADVQEVRYCKFELVQDGKGVCSNCHRLDSIDKLAKYCRYCGAFIKRRDDSNG